MATATLINVWRDSTYAYAAATVPEGGGKGTVEYMAQTLLLDDQGNPKTQAQLKSDLTAALALVRQAQLATPAPIPGISGAITL
jgi:hypothetical protein